MATHPEGRKGRETRRAVTRFCRSTAHGTINANFSRSEPFHCRRNDVERYAQTPQKSWRSSGTRNRNGETFTSPLRSFRSNVFLGYGTAERSDINPASERDGAAISADCRHFLARVPFGRSVHASGGEPRDSVN